MALSFNDRVLLQALVTQIVTGEAGRGIRLFPMQGRFRSDQDEIIFVLAEEMKRQTGGGLTIKRADVALFAHQAMGPGLYLVVCPADVPEEKVTQVGVDMNLLFVGPYGEKGSVEYPAEQASSQEQERHRAATADIERNRVLRQQGKQDAEVFLALLKQALYHCLVTFATTPETRDRVQYLLNSTTLSLESVAAATAALGIPFNQLVRQAVGQ